jgi:glyoxylase-like metal-dependent hydrolase (beta-lactamase superfamily II)
LLYISSLKNKKLLQVHHFTFNPFQENTYLIQNNQQECWIVDPGMSNPEEEQVLLQFIEDRKLIPQAIINTHAHIDHILGIDFVAQHFKIPLLIHEKELPILNNAANTARMFGFQYDGVQTLPQFISEKKSLKLGEESIEIRFVPGHSPGSIAFYSKENNWVISGDALFAGSIGRTDLLMGNYEVLIASIKTQLLTLPEATIVYSGHGPETTIGNEKTSNPFLQ